MKLRIYQIDAFASSAFSGNPAAVIPLESWLPHETMQRIAQENNLSETAFFVPKNDGFHIRWFTPNNEVKLCGHATLAAAFVLYSILGFKNEYVKFDSLSGVLTVSRTGTGFTLDFPAEIPEPCDTPRELIDGLGKAPVECRAGQDYLAVYAHEKEILDINPNHEQLKKLARRAVVVTAPSDKYDFVVRVFAPKYDIPEDPVTGSAYTQLTPYWSGRLGKNKLTARQVSSRGGDVTCRLSNDRVLISGSAVKYLEGEIEIET